MPTNSKLREASDARLVAQHPVSDMSESQDYRLESALRALAAVLWDIAGHGQILNLTRREQQLAGDADPGLDPQQRPPADGEPQWTAPSLRIARATTGANSLIASHNGKGPLFPTTFWTRSVAVLEP